jgi:hypothetical protein
MSVLGAPVPVGAWRAAAQRWVIGRRAPVMLAMMIVGALPALIALRPVLDSDIWWHLRTGGWIIQHHAVPRADPFALSGLPRSWVADSWLFDLLVHGLYGSFGLAGLVFYRLLLCSAIAIALYCLSTRSIARPPTVIAVPALAVFAMMPMFGTRPDLLSMLIYTIELAVLFSALECGGRGRVWVLPPLLALWANLHIAFVYGLLVLVLAAVSQRLDQKYGRDSVPVEVAPRLGLVAVASAAATLATPYHVMLYAQAVEQLRQAALSDVVGDLMALQFRRPEDWIVLGLALWAATMAGQRRSLQTFMVLLLGVTSFASFRSGRDAWLLVVSAAAIISTPPFPAETQTHSPLVRLRHIVVVALVVVGILGIAVWRRGPLNGIWQTATAGRFPVAAARTIEERRYAGPLYCPLEWGGYLLWRLPNLSVTLDSRTDLYGEARIRRSVKTWQGHRGWETDPDLEGAASVVAPAQTPLTALLLGDPRFAVIYNDAVATVFVARPAANGAGQDAVSHPGTAEGAR